MNLVVQVMEIQCYNYWNNHNSCVNGDLIWLIGFWYVPKVIYPIRLTWGRKLTYFP